MTSSNESSFKAVSKGVLCSNDSQNYDFFYSLFIVNNNRILDLAKNLQNSLEFSYVQINTRAN